MPFVFVGAVSRVAPNIYYLGFAGVVNFGGVRIGGISGIYKSGDYHRGHFEKPPFSDRDIRSFYHVREYEVFQLSQLTKPLDVFLCAFRRRCSLTPWPHAL